MTALHKKLSKTGGGRTSLQVLLTSARRRAALASAGLWQKRLAQRLKLQLNPCTRARACEYTRYLVRPGKHARWKNTTMAQALVDG